jgi:MFS family permease
MVTERPMPGGGQRNLWAAIQKMPAQFRRYLVGIGVFGAGDFSHTLLILAATQILRPSWGPTRAAQFAALLYVLRNVSYALFSFPVGALSDRLNRRSLLTAGYVVAAAVMTAFGLLFAFPVSVEPTLFVLFLGAGLFIATEDALEGALTADLVPDETVRATAFGLLGVVNAAGDLVSSLVVGALWVVAPWTAFAYAAVVMLAGSIVMGTYR